MSRLTVDNMDNSVKKARKQVVALRNDLIQRSRYSLSAIENKVLLYILSLVKPTDAPGLRYSFYCNDFLRVIKSKNQSYTALKQMLTRIAQVVWWMDIDDDTEALLRWFNIVHMSRGTGMVTISFHEDVFPYIIGLNKQQLENGSYFTAYQLQNISRMQHQYSPRIYQLLKSYQYNNMRWIFEIGTGSKHDLQRRISDTDEKGNPVMPASWKSFGVFNRDVLKPAMEDINKYTDIKIMYEPSKIDLKGAKHRGYVAVKFTMLPKTAGEIEDTEHMIDAEYQEVEEDQFRQLSLFDMSTEEMDFVAAHKEKVIKESTEANLSSLAEAQIEQEEIQEAAAEERSARIRDSQFPFLTEAFPEFTDRQIEAIGRSAFKLFSPMLSMNEWGPWSVDYVVHYYDYVKATPEDTRTTVFKRLLDAVRKDYDGFAVQLNHEYRPQITVSANINQRYESYIDILKRNYV